MGDDEPGGATPIEDEEAEDLLPAHVRTRQELNVWEQENILGAARWVDDARRDPFQESTLRELHRRMFGETWRWAGQYRRSNRNIGVDWPTIPEAVRNILDDGRLWFLEDVYPVDEAIVRLHHRLVQVHPFPNGNGRHARLWGDMLSRRLSRPPIEWKGRALGEPGDARGAYIGALRSADAGDYGPLLRLFLSR